jgi:hypothetical protein
LQVSVVATLSKEEERKSLTKVGGEKTVLCHLLYKAHAEGKDHREDWLLRTDRAKLDLFCTVEHGR